MHAGDGNCHVNIPVNSNDLHMLEVADAAAVRAMTTAGEMGGAVSGEHGIGITKIRFLSRERMDELRAFKQRVDPREVFNPAKLVQPELPVRPFTFSFNRLIEDIRQSGLPNKQTLISLLASVQICTRCGKCKHVCPMVHAGRSFHYHPRNRNITLGALIEAVYYSQINTGRPDAALMAELGRMIDHCTACGRCYAVCPVNIPSEEVALELRAFLEDEGAGGHPLKNRVLRWACAAPGQRVPRFGKAASVGQRVQNNLLGFVPAGVRRRMRNPLFSGPGPRIGYTSLYETLRLEQGGLFVPDLSGAVLPGEAIFYFPGCGAGVFARRIALAGLALLLRCGYGVVLPETHMCCGYPLLSCGLRTLFAHNLARNRDCLVVSLDKARAAGFVVAKIATTCGTCHEALHRHEPETMGLTEAVDITRFVLQNLPPLDAPLGGERFIYQASCHGEVPGEHRTKCAGRQAMALEAYTGAVVKVSAGCCGESGTGAITSPEVYNVLRERKQLDLAALLPGTGGRPVLVGCPSCKQGIGRTLLNMGEGRRRTLHTTEWLAELVFRQEWGTRLWRTIRRNSLQVTDERGIRHVDVGLGERSV
jgi:Fe-S oxidoreductase